MTTYLLHGGMVRVESSENDAYFKRIADAVPDGGTALIVLFAAEEERWQELFDGLQKLIERQGGGKHMRFVLATSGGFVEEARAADAIVIRGGSTNRLLDALRSYPVSFPELFDGKLVTGSSAGAYAIAQFGYDKSNKAVRNGLGLLPVRVLCHYLSDMPSERTDDEAVAVLNASHRELPLILLKDCEWKELSS